MRRIVLASHNSHKTAEIRAILAPLHIQLLNLTDFPAAPVPDETGGTFTENAKIKALSALTFTGLPALADDSGLVVPALDGEPGVRSARYAGDGAGDLDNNSLLLRNMAEIPPDRRTAKFVAAVVLALPDGQIMEFVGEVEGHILASPAGDGGFGYDPLFFSAELGCTFAEAEPEAKNRISHRARALAGLTRTLGQRKIFLA